MDSAEKARWMVLNHVLWFPWLAACMTGDYLIDPIAAITVPSLKAGMPILHECGWQPRAVGSCHLLQYKYFDRDTVLYPE